MQMRLETPASGPHGQQHGRPPRACAAKTCPLSCAPLPLLLLDCSVNSNMGQLTYTAKLESVAASAVKSADKVGAALMVVVTHTGE